MLATEAARAAVNYSNYCLPTEEKTIYNQFVIACIVAKTVHTVINEGFVASFTSTATDVAVAAALGELGEEKTLSAFVHFGTAVTHYASALITAVGAEITRRTQG